MPDSKKIVLKVNIVADECKATRAMNIAARFCGVKSVAVDRDTGTLTVVGAVDVVRVAKKLRKANFEVQVLSVGPEVEKKPDEAAKKPAEEPKKPPPPTPCCPGCAGSGPPPCFPGCSVCCPPPPFPGAVVCYEEPPAGCVIL